MAEPQNDADKLLDGELQEAGTEVRDETPLSELLDKFPITDQEKALWLILRQHDETKVWRPEWEVYMGVKPTKEMLSNMMPGQYAILGFSEEAKEEVESIRKYSFTTLPEGAELFEIKTVVVMSGSEDAGARSEAERAMAHFNISKEDWEKLTEKEKEDYISKLPERGEGGMDEELTDEEEGEIREDFAALEELDEEDAEPAKVGIFKVLKTGKKVIVQVTRKAAGVLTKRGWRYIKIVPGPVLPPLKSGDKEYPLPAGDKPFGFSWKQLGYGDAGPRGVKLFPEGMEYPKPEDGKDFTPWEGGHIVFGPKGFVLIPKSDKYPYPYPYPKPKDASAMLDSGETQPVLMVDSATFHIADDGFQVADGVMKVPATIATPMVQEYRMGDKMVRILKCPDQLKKAVDFADGRYVCDDHPLERRVTQPQQVKGRLHDSKLNEKGGIDTVLSITDASLQKKVENGKRDVSIGFDCALLWKSGTFTDAEGKEFAYDAIQVNILIDHVAVVEQGRCSIFDGCGIHTDATTAAQLEELSALDDLKGQVAALELEIKTPLADHILSVSDKKTKEELLTLPLTDLKELEALVLDAKPADLPGGATGGAQNLRKAIDDKLASIGENIG